MALFLLLLPLLLPLATAQPPWQSCGRDGGNYTANSAYQANLRLLSSTLPTRTSSNATFFATGTAGDTPDDTVYAMAFCRRDMINATACSDCVSTACSDCVSTAFQDAQQLCAYNKEATVYNDACTTHFSNRNFLSTTDNVGGVVILINQQNFTTSVSLSLFTLLNSTALSAAKSSRRYALSRLEVNSAPKLYCVMECTPDLNADDCAACLKDFPRLALQYLDGRRGGQIMGVRCSMRYEQYPFYRGEPMLLITNLAAAVPAINNTTLDTPVTNLTMYPKTLPPAAAAPPPEAQTTVQEQRGRNSRKSKVWIAAIAAPLLSILLCCTFSFAWMRRRRNGRANLQDQAMLNTRKEEDALVWRLEEKSSEFTLFEFSEVLDVTANFSEENRLGQGGFGPVYKGQLPNGLEIAVKRLSSHSGQGFTEFKNEVELIAKLQHNNLVRLLGCCIQGEEKILVYEYLPNKSLDFFIFDGKKKSLLDWNKRRAIIEGIAQGLLYLHKHSRLRVIHRDLKASNILLDKDMNPKISDFGLAKIFSSNDTQGSTRRVVGTYGYMSPEYASEGIYSIKSDVFSFGVLLLEILSGIRNSGFHQHGDFLNLLGYSWHLWEEGRWLELLEASIAKEIHTADARKNINIALMCVQESADDRPTMSDVVAMLNSERDVLPDPNHPAYFNLRVSKAHESAAVVIEQCSINGVTITVEPDGR